MSLLVTETNQVIDRLCLFTPTVGELMKVNESIGFELTTLVGQDQRLDLKMAPLAKGPIRTWTSFTLGLRGDLPLRISMLGGTTQDSLKELPLLLELSEAILFYLPETDERSDHILRFKVPPAYREKPAIFLGLLNPTSQSLRAKVLQEWSQRNFKHNLYLPLEDGFFARSLEWALSF